MSAGFRTSTTAFSWLTRSFCVAFLAATLALMGCDTVDSMNADLEAPESRLASDAMAKDKGGLSTYDALGLVGSWVDARPDPQFEPVVTFRIDGVVKVKTQCYLYRGEYEADEQGNLRVSNLKLKDQWCDAFRQDPIVDTIEEATAWETSRDEQLLSVFSNSDVQSSVTLRDADDTGAPQENPDEPSDGPVPTGDNPNDNPDSPSDGPVPTGDSPDENPDGPRGN